MLQYSTDLSLPASERECFKRCNKSLEGGLVALSQAARYGTWKMEIQDAKALYDVGPFAPNSNLAERIVDALLPSLRRRFEKLYIAMQDRLRKYASNCKIIIRADSHAPSACTTEFSNGNMIFRVREFYDLAQWGDDMLLQMELLANPGCGSPGSQITPELGLSLAESLRIDSPSSPEEAIQMLVKLGSLDKPLQKTHDFPLIMCVNWGRADVARLLIDTGANINIRNEDERTVLTYACYLTSKDWARRYKYLDIMKLLLLRPEVDINAQDKLGRTPLMYLAETGNFEGIELLLDDPRVDVNFENRKMQTALDFAVEAKNGWLVKVLTARKGEPRKTTAPPSAPNADVQKIPTAGKKMSMPSAPTLPIQAVPSAPKYAIPMSQTKVQTSTQTNQTVQQASKIVKDLFGVHNEAHLDFTLAQLEADPIKKLDALFADFGRKVTTALEHMKRL